MHATHGAVTKVVPSHTPQPSAIAAEHPPPRFWIPPPQTKGYPLLKLDISMIMLAMMLSAVRGWSLPPSDESAQGSPLSLVNQSEITDGVVLAHDRQLHGLHASFGLAHASSCDGWSISPLRPTLSCNERNQPCFLVPPAATRLTQTLYTRGRRPRRGSPILVFIHAGEAAYLESTSQTWLLS